MNKYIDLFIKWIKIVEAFVLDLLYTDVDDDTPDDDISEFI